MAGQSPSERSQELFHACAGNGAEHPWADFLGRFAPRIRTAVRRALRSSGPRGAVESEDDLVQEVFCRLLGRDGRALEAFRGASEGEAIAYLRRIARSVVVDAVRTAGAEKRGGTEGAPPLPSRDLDEAHALVDLRSCPERRLLLRERRRIFLARCREALPEGGSPAEALRVVALAVLEGRSSRDIAARLGDRWPPSRIDSLLSRLRRRLAGRGIEIPRRTDRLAAGG